MTIIGKAFAAIAAALLLLCIALGFGLYHYRVQAAEYARDLVVAGANKQTCESALQEQREYVEKLKIEPKQPEVITQVKYRDKIVVKYVDRNITQEECRETSAHIDAARRLFP